MRFNFTIFMFLVALLAGRSLGAVTLSGANELLSRQAYEEAIVAYESVGELSSAKREGWRLNNWALCYLRSNQPAKAIPLLEKSVKIKADNSVAWNNLGSAYERTGDKVKALEVYKSAVKTIRQQLEEYWKGIEDKDKAKADIPDVEAAGFIEEVTELSSENAKGKIREAKAMLDEGKYKEAISIYGTIGKTRYKKREGWKFNNWGLCYLMEAEEREVGSKKNLQEALTRFKKAVEAIPGNAVAWNNLGVTYEKLGGLVQAGEAYGKAIEVAEEGDTTRMRAELNRVKVEYLIEKANAEVERK